MSVPWRTIVVMPAYNAANTLQRVYDDIPKDQVVEIIVVDDCSKDDTVEIARRLPVTLIRHERNTGYGGNQKTCYDTARAHGADFVVMIHADYQYDARMIPTRRAALAQSGHRFSDQIMRQIKRA